MNTRHTSTADRRDFLLKAGLGVAAAGTLLVGFAVRAGVRRAPVERHREAVSPRHDVLAAAPPVQVVRPRHAQRGDDRAAEEVRRDHDARPAAVDEGQLPRRLPPRPLVGRVRRPGRRGAVHGDDRRAQRQAVHGAPLGSERAGVEEVGGEAGVDHREREVRVPAHLEQRAAVPGRPRRHEAEGRHPRRQALDGHRRGARRQDDAGEHRHVERADHAGGAGPRDRLPEEREDRGLPEEVHRVVQGTGRLRRQGRA